MDWNDDGLNDLIVGEHKGHVKLFMAVTADSLTEAADLQAGGVDISTGLIATPAVFDWNNDSLNDLVVGFPSANAIPGSTIKLYLNTGTPGNPILDTAVDVLCAGKPVRAYGSTPSFYDLDQDGLSDLIYGEISGKINFCKNIGTLSAPVFAAPEAMQTQEGNISLNIMASPVITDWNDDNYPDLLVGTGETGYLYAYLSPYTNGISHSGSEKNDLAFDVLSNPVSSSLIIKINSDRFKVLDASLYSLTGRLALNMGSKDIYNGENSLQFTVGPMPSGVYLLRLSSENTAASKLITIIGGTQ